MVASSKTAVSSHDAPTSTAANDDAAVRPRGRPRDPEVERCILAAAVDVLTEGGFEKFSVEAVASRAGVAKASIYRRYPSRVDLIVAMVQQFTPAAAPDIDSGELRSDLRLLVDFLLATFDPKTEAGRITPAMLSAAKEYTEVREAVAQLTASRRRRIDAIVERAIARGELPRNADADLIGDLVVGGILYRVVLRGEALNRRQIDRLIDGLVDGFA